MADDLRQRYADAIARWALMNPIPAWSLSEGERAEKLARNWGRVAAEAVLAVRDDELAALRDEVHRMTLAYNAANAMRGVHEHRADRLRNELEHAKAALAGDNEGIHQWMLTCTRVAERRREQVDHWQREAEQAEAVIERARAIALTGGQDAADVRRQIIAALDQPADGEQTGGGNG